MEKFKEFLSCARVHSFPAAIAPILVGSSFSLSYISRFNVRSFVLFLIACLLIQTATNYFNEYYDFKKGLDKIDSEGISGSIVKGKLSAKEVFNAALVACAIAIIIGMYLSYITSYKLFLVGLVCILAGYFYTGGKYPIAYSPFGELVAGLFMGTIIIAIAFYLQTGYVNLAIILVSLPLFILVGGILLANNIRDLDNDKASGRRTFAILVGKKTAVLSLALGFLVVYLLNIIYSLTSIGSVFNLLVLGTLPLAVKIIKGFDTNLDKKTMAPYMVMTAKLTILVGLLMALAYLLEYLL